MSFLVALLMVSASGPGIPPEERERVFDRFYRLPGTEAEGSGLCLAIVKQIAEAHRGAPFDLVLLDPPYDDAALEAAVRAAGAILKDDGVVVLEHATRVTPPAGARRTVRAGDSSLSFYDTHTG